MDQDALGTTLAEAQIDAKDGKEEAVVLVCAGPPTCCLEGQDALEEMNDNCHWCSWYRVLEDGSFVYREAAVGRA